MDSLLKRDSNATRCYAWEAIAFPVSPQLAPDMTRILVAQVHADIIRLIGDGAAHPNPDVRFDIRRDGLAAGRWGMMRFGANGAELETVLHEIGHSLTWNGRYLYELASQKNTGARLKGVRAHLDFVLCNEGHGPKFVACLLALMQRYGGTDISRAVRLAREGFSYGMRSRDGTRKVHSGVKLPLDMPTLEYWQRVLCK